LRNVEEMSAFVLDIGSLSLSHTMHKSSNNHSPEADEFERVDPPLGTGRLVIGKTGRFHLKDKLFGENGCASL
jgi:hypothetical protein